MAQLPCIKQYVLGQLENYNNNDLQLNNMY